jgi:hypothetical protein
MGVLGKLRRDKAMPCREGFGNPPYEKRIGRREHFHLFVVMRQRHG